MSRQPHPMNVAGDFYVEDGCCTDCGFPMVLAPSLFETIQDCRDYTHCFVQKQPENPIELKAMIESVYCAELRCIRYRGTDREIQTRLFDNEDAGQCDHLLSDLQEQLDQWKD